MKLLRLPVPIVGALLLATLSDIPSRISLGGFTLSAGLTTLVALSAVALFPSLVAHGTRTLAPLALFILWAFITGVVRGFTYDGIQNLTVFITFVLVTWVASTSDESIRADIQSSVLALGLVVAVLFGISTLAEGFGRQTLFSARVFGIQALAFMGATVPAPRTTRRARVLPWALLILVGASLSRTALVVAALMMAIRAAHGRQLKLGRSVVAAGLGVLAMLWAVFNVSSLNSRVFGEDASFKIAGISINSTGRSAIWQELTEDIEEPHLFGFGPGASSTKIRNGSTGAEEPHNDYLRLLYDYGWPGVILFVWGIFRPLRKAVRLSWGNRRNLVIAAPHTAAALSIVAIAVLMATDNVLIYSWAMAPLGVLIGVSIAATPASGPSRYFGRTDRLLTNR